MACSAVRPREAASGRTTTRCDEDGDRHRLHVVGGGEVTTAGRRPRPGGPGELQRGPRRQAEREALVAAARLGDVDEVALQRVGQVHRFALTSDICTTSVGGDHRLQQC